MTTAQQPSVYYFASTTEGQSPVFIQMQAIPEGQVTSGNMYLRKHHKLLGILQMSVGCLCLTLEIIGVCSAPLTGIMYTGFYTGTVFFIAGLLGYLAYQKNNYGLIIACMVMSIIAALTVVSGITTSVIEMNVLVPFYHRRITRNLQIAKEAIIIGACVFEMFTCIIHAAFTCATCCRCCRPGERRTIPTTLLMQQSNHTGVQQGPMYAAACQPIIEDTMMLPVKRSPPPNGRVDTGSNNDPPPYSQLLPSRH